MKILILGLGYVGTANAILLSQHNEVICFDIDNNRVDQINNHKSPVEDKEGSRYLSEKKLNLKAVSEFPSLEDYDFIIIATPTNYSPETNYFDTSSIKSCLEEIEKQKLVVVRLNYENLQFVLDLTRKKIEIKGVSY